MTLPLAAAPLLLLLKLRLFLFPLVTLLFHCGPATVVPVCLATATTFASCTTRLLGTTALNAGRTPFLPAVEVAALLDDNNECEDM